MNAHKGDKEAVGYWIERFVNNANCLTASVIIDTI